LLKSKVELELEKFMQEEKLG